MNVQTSSPATMPASQGRIADNIVDELLILHSRIEATGTCRTCSDEHGWPELWPCPTIRITRRVIKARGQR
jgi:hypothetical protein